MAIKVLLDTDIGSDIDDAVCLAYLLAQPECELLGITTVTGEAVERAKIASALCKAAGKDVPIYPGTEQPLIVDSRQPHCPQAAALARWPHETHFTQGEAVDFLRRTIRAHPGEITLLAIGPMTNVALLFSLDPEIPRLLHSLTMMIGLFTEQPPTVGELEWNSICDPHASAIVYKASAPRHRSIGIDVTRHVILPSAEVRQRFQTGLLRPVLDFAEVWFKERDVITFHDPLAATTIFDPAICGFETGAVEVNLSDPLLVGRTHWLPGAGPHEVALTVDPARFFEHYFAMLGG